MKRDAVKSTTMRSVGYQRGRRILEIEFQSGTVYQYLEVPQEVYGRLARAESKGQYFNDEIRDSYECVRMGAAKRRAGS